MTEYAEFETFRPTMDREELVEWFVKKLNRYPEPFDLYKIAKDFYALGSYSRALICLDYYISLPGANVSGRHLLAYCLLNLGEIDKALVEFKKCVREGYHDDWQLVIELTFEIDEKINQISSIAGNARILNKFIDGNL